MYIFTHHAIICCILIFVFTQSGRFCDMTYSSFLSVGEDRSVQLASLNVCLLSSTRGRQELNHLFVE